MSFANLMLLCAVLVLSVGSTVTAEAKMLSPEEFTILPWGWSPGDKETLQGIKDCGFNLAGFVAPDSVKTCGEVGLKCIVMDPGLAEAAGNPKLSDADIAKRTEDAAAKFKDDPTVYGYYLRDEPAASLFPNLSRISAALRKVDPDTTPYINLLPIYANEQQLGVGSYEAYVDSFATGVKPQFISYDHYALMDDGSLRDGYFQNLEIVRKAALKHGLPFWNIVLGNAHFHYAEPSQYTLNFQAYTTLAYGARGISYFTYFAPKIGNYRLAAVDQFGDRTPTWNDLRRVNLQIHKLGPTYVKLKSVNVFHHPDVPEGCSGISTSKHLSELSGGAFVVGEFEGPNGKPYVMVVNKDWHKSTAFSLKFKQQGQIMLTNAYTGNLEPWTGENDWLAPGQGMLLSLE